MGKEKEKRRRKGKWRKEKRTERTKDSQIKLAL